MRLETTQLVEKISVTPRLLTPRNIQKKRARTPIDHEKHNVATKLCSLEYRHTYSANALKVVAYSVKPNGVNEEKVVSVGTSYDATKEVLSDA